MAIKLHFGHMVVFLSRRCLARFLKDRIGPDNVILFLGQTVMGRPLLKNTESVLDLVVVTLIKDLSWPITNAKNKP